MHVFAGEDIQVGALFMRIINVALFVGLSTALVALLPSHRRRTILWGWLVTLVPLGMFLIPSNNPSGWAITGVGTAFLALLGWFESAGQRRWALGAIYIVGMIMAAGARGDSAVYASGATLGATLMSFSGIRSWQRALWLPAAGLVIAVVLFAMAGQTGVATTGFTGEAAAPPTQSEEALPPGLSLAVYNLLMLPLLWTGVWGTWGLGWLDTQPPAIVPWAAVSAFVVVAFAGLGRLDWRKAVTGAGILSVLIALPVQVLTASGFKVGTGLQPRYILPLIILFAFVLLTDTTTKGLRFTRLQTFTILASLAIANIVALQVNIRRYVTGVGQQGLNLDYGAQWWWAGFPIGPLMVWLIGGLAYAGLLVVLWPQLRRTFAVANH